MTTSDSIWTIDFFGSHNVWLHAGILLLAVVLIVIILGGCFLLHSGILKKIEVLTKESPYDEMTVAYKTGKGPYKGASLLCNEVMSILEKSEKQKQKNDDTAQAEYRSPLVIGLYYDDPESVPEDELRFAVGAVISRGKESPDTGTLESMISQGYKITVFPKPAFVVTASFPLKTKLSLYIAIFRVYPRLREYINTKGLCAYPAMEFYSQDQLQFVMPLSKQEEFFVPEFCEEQVSIATTEFSTHAPSETNKSYLTGIDESGSVSGTGSIHEDSNLDITSSDIQQTPDRRVKEDFGGDDQISIESESEDLTAEEDEEPDRVFIKPTKPAPRRKRSSQGRVIGNTGESIKEHVHVDTTSTISQNADCEMPRIYSELEDPSNNEINECSNLNAISCSENSSMEDLANHFDQGT